MAAELATFSEIDNMSLDEVDLAHLWLDAVEEARFLAQEDLA